MAIHNIIYSKIIDLNHVYFTKMLCAQIQQQVQRSVDRGRYNKFINHDRGLAGNMEFPSLECIIILLKKLSFMEKYYLISYKKPIIYST